MEPDKQFTHDCLMQLHNDLRKMLAMRNQNLADLDVTRTDLQDAILRLQRDIVAVEYVLEQRA